MGVLCIKLVICKVLEDMVIMVGDMDLIMTEGMVLSGLIMLAGITVNIENVWK